MAFRNQNNGRARQRTEEYEPDVDLMVPEQPGMIVPAGDYGDRAVQVASAASLSMEEIRVAAMIAHANPRSEDKARLQVLDMCKRKDFAEKSRYVFQRGGTVITGPSIVAARAIARVWGNLKYGYKITSDDPKNRSIVGFCWDMQGNTQEEQADTFRKLIQRKIRDKTEWVVPDERDLGELTKRKAALLTRNCILHLIPWTLLAEIQAIAAQTLKSEIEQDPARARTDILEAFHQIGVPVDEIAEYLRHDVASASPAEIETLRGIYRAINGGEAYWVDYYQKPTSGSQGVEVTGKARDMFRGAAASTEERPGGDKRNLLPTHLMQDREDKRPLFEYLEDLIPISNRQDRDKIAAALPSLDLKPKDREFLILMLGQVNAEDEAETSGGEQTHDPNDTAGRQETTEPEQKEPVDQGPPLAVMEFVTPMAKARGVMVVDMQIKKWAAFLEGFPQYQEFDAFVRAAATEAKERIAAKKK